MQIQRWQSLMLLVAAILMAVYCFIPFAYTPGPVEGVEVPIYAVNYPVLLIVTILTAVLLLIDIFLYKNLRVQMNVALVCFLLTLVVMATYFILMFKVATDAYVAYFWGGSAIPGFALILIGLAYTYMRRDRNLLKSYDRLR